MRLTFSSFALSLALIFVSAAAMGCIRACPSIEELYKNAFVVFEGKVTSNSDPKKIEMEVLSFYKGIPSKKISLDLGNNGTSCDTTIMKQRKYMIFANGVNLDSLHVSGCEAILAEVYTNPPLAGAPSLPKEIPAPKFPFLETRQKQLHALENAILEQREDADSLLRVKAEDFLYWQDYQQAELVLEQIVTSKPDDTWAINELMGVLYHQQKAQKIWNTYQLLKLRNGHDLVNINLGRSKIAMATSLTSLLLNNQFDFSLRFVLENIHLQGLEKSGVDARDASLNKVTMQDGDLSSINFSNARIEDSSFNHMNFSRSIFTDANLTDANFYSTDFTGAIFTRAKISNGKFRNVNFEDALLTGVHFVDTDYDCATIWPENFDPVAAGGRLVGKCDKGLWSKVKKILP